MAEAPAYANAPEAVSNADDNTGHGSKVAQHYNNLQETGLAERAKSKIFYLRNFNNWIKSQCIGDTLARIKADGRRDIKVLDLCCGKGGDILKWKKGDVSHVVFADIAETSVEQCEGRYKEMVDRARHDRRNFGAFTAEFYTEDCSKVRLKDKYMSPDIQYDLVSCQFSFHYSFESYEQADMMARNACECLRPGGYFIGTTPDSYELMKRLNLADESLSFGNDVYNVKFASKDLPLFGAKYDFHLEGVVDCPEFLVYFPALERIAAKYGMKLISRIPFAKYFERQIREHEGRSLIGKMQALEPYPADEDVELSSSILENYKHAKAAIEKLERESDGDDGRRRGPKKVGTLSKSEWEATSIYCFFIFQKMKSASQKRSHDDQESEATQAKQAKKTPE